MDTEKQKLGRLYGVGVGPGDPELITLRAYHVLSRVPVIFVPQKDSESMSYANSIIDSLVNTSQQEVVGLVFPMIRDKRRLAGYWRQAADSMWQYLREGKDCAFINVGDPLLYGTFIHIFDTLKESHPEIDVEVIPGISSVNAVAARTLVPLASNDERIAIISAGCDDNFIRETLKNFDTVVFMKTHTMFDKLLAIIEEMDMVERCVFVRRCTTQDEEIVRDIRKLRGKKLDYFSLMMVRR